VRERGRTIEVKIGNDEEANMTGAQRVTRRAADEARPGYRPAPGTALLTCARCGAYYLDDPEARAAHVTVFGHRPRRQR
jgi:hypothetical protein